MRSRGTEPMACRAPGVQAGRSNLRKPIATDKFAFKKKQMQTSELEVFAKANKGMIPEETENG